MVTPRNEYNPDYSVHPGEILFETLEARDITHSELAARTGLSLKTVSQITNSRAPITSETAIQLERVLGISATLWNNLDANYRLHQARVASRKVNERRLKWLDGFPIRELTQLGVLPSGLTRPEKLERLLEFFGVASPRAWKTRYRHLAVSFRKSLAFKSSLESVSCWLRLGELEAERVETAPYNKTKFRRALKYIRKLTVLPPGEFIPKLRKTCSDSGVVLIFVSELPKTRLCGAALWLTKDKALIQLSLRYKSDDHFWFSFFHEAAHILHHSKKGVFIDDELEMGKNEIETGANNFARNLLIPQNKYDSFVKQSKFYDADILRFAQEIGIAPGIVVGILQHEEKIEYQWHNKLKKRFRLVSS